MSNLVDVKEIMKKIKNADSLGVEYEGNIENWIKQVEDMICRDKMQCNIETIDEFLKNTKMKEFDNMKNAMYSNQVMNFYHELEGNCFKRFVKKCIRKIMKCILLPMACSQTEFNKNAYSIIVMQQEEIQELKNRIKEISDTK